MSHNYDEDLNRSYVSEYDRFLQAFDAEHPQHSLSQKKEIAKHQRIAEYRDRVQQDESL